MDSIIFLILRRMRAPLITLIITYAISMLGFTLMPGVDSNGKPWSMSIFEAFYVASTGRPGPVLVDLPKDMTAQEIEFSYPETIDMRSYKPQTQGNPRAVRRAVEAMFEAERPVLYIGGGAIHAGAHDEAGEALKRHGVVPHEVPQVGSRSDEQGIDPG